MRAGSQSHYGVVTGTVLEFSIVRGRGIRGREGRIVSVVNGEMIVSIATNERKMEMKKQVTTQWEEALFSIPLFQASKNED